MKKSLVSLILVICMIAATLAGCGGAAPASSGGEAAPASESAAPSGEKILIRMIDSLAADNRTTALNKIIDAYMKENPNIEIELISPPAEGSDAKILNMLNSE